MNAFLLFCKKHRKQVREKYPHLENRQVTKILGEWWADLDANEKTGYQELARQLKEAFLRANPDFKWYKIPSQPPRPPPARPSNQKVPRHQPNPTSTSAITFGKLADENLMGRLSTLLSPVPSSAAAHTSDLLLSSSPPHCQLVAREAAAALYDRPVTPDKGGSVAVPHSSEALTLNLTHATVIHVPVSNSHHHHPTLWRHASNSVSSLPYTHLKSGVSCAPDQVFLYETSEPVKVESVGGGEDSLTTQSWSPDYPEFVKPLPSSRAVAKSEDRTILSHSVSNKITQKSSSKVILLGGSGSTVLRVPSFSCAGLSPAIDETAIAHKEDIAVNALSALACSSFVIPTEGQPQDSKHFSCAQAAPLSNSTVSIDSSCASPSYTSTDSSAAGFVVNSGPCVTTPITASNSISCNGVLVTSVSGLSLIGDCTAATISTPVCSSALNSSCADASAMTETPAGSVPPYTRYSAVGAACRFKPAVNGSAPPSLHSTSSVSWASGGSGTGSESPQLKCSLAFTSAHIVSGSSSSTSSSPSCSSGSNVSLSSLASLPPTVLSAESKKSTIGSITAHMTPPKPPKKRYLDETMHRPPTSPPLVNSSGSSSNNNYNNNNNNNEFSANNLSSETDPKRIKLSHCTGPSLSSGFYDVGQPKIVSHVSSDVGINCSSGSSSNSVPSSIVISHYTKSSTEVSSRPSSLPFYHDSYQNSPAQYFVPSRRASECAVTQSVSTFAEQQQQQQQQPLNLTHSPLESQSPSPVSAASRSSLALACVSPSSSALPPSPTISLAPRYTYAIEVPVAERYPHTTEVRIGGKYSDTTSSDQPLNLIMGSSHDHVISGREKEQRWPKEKEERLESRTPWQENNNARQLAVVEWSGRLTQHQENNLERQEKNELLKNQEQKKNKEHDKDELQVLNKKWRDQKREVSEMMEKKDFQHGKEHEREMKKKEQHGATKDSSGKKGLDKEKYPYQQSDMSNQTFIEYIVDSIFQGPHKSSCTPQQNAFSSAGVDNDSQRGTISSVALQLSADHNSGPQLKRQHPPKTYSLNKSCGSVKTYPGGFQGRAARQSHAEMGSALCTGQTAAVVGSSADSSVKLMLVPSLSSQSTEKLSSPKTFVLTEDEFDSPPEGRVSKSDARSSASCPASPIIAPSDSDALTRQSPNNSIANASEVSISTSHNKKNLRGRTSKDRSQSDNMSPDTIMVDKILPDRNSQRRMLITKANSKAKFSRKNALANDSKYSESHEVPPNDCGNDELSASVSSSCDTAPSEVPSTVTLSPGNSSDGQSPQVGALNCVSRAPTASTMQPTPEQHRRIIDQTIIDSINRNTIDKEKEDRDFELFCKSKRAVELGVVVGSRATSNSSALSSIVIPKSTPCDKNSSPKIVQPHSGGKNAVKSNFGNLNEPQVSLSPKVCDSVRTIPSSISRGNNKVRVVDYCARNEVVGAASNAEAVSSACAARNLTSSSPPACEGPQVSGYQLTSVPHSDLHAPGVKPDRSSPAELGKKRKAAVSVNAKKMRRGGWAGRSSEVGAASRASRACKGKRYQELIDEGVLQSGRRTRARAAAAVLQAGRNDDDYKEEDGIEEPQMTEAVGELGVNNNAQSTAAEADLEPDVHHSKSPEELSASHPECLSPSCYFDLEAKIEALPYLSLDDFTRRKKENKKKASSSSTGPLPSTASDAGGDTDTQFREDSAAGVPQEGVSSTSKGCHSMSRPELGHLSNHGTCEKALLPSRSSGVHDNHPTSTRCTNSALPNSLHSASNTSNHATDTGSKHCFNESKRSTKNSATSVTESSSTLVWSCSVQSSSNSSTSVSSSSLNSNNNNSNSSTSSIISNSSSSSSSSECCEDCDQTPLTGSQRRKARKQTITRHDPLSSATNLKAAVVDPGVLSSMGLQTLADAALEQHSMKT